jgi:hypothetical protein
VKVTQENSWYESLAQLFAHPPEFFASHAIRVFSKKAEPRYGTKKKELTIEIAWPTKTTGELLAEALGTDHIIDSADHPIYVELLEGMEFE